MLRNRAGRAVDPVPFLVVTGLSFLGCYSFFPVYCLSFGLSVSAAVAVTTAVFLALAGGAYYRLVWTARPEVRSEVSPGLRLEYIFYGALAVAGVFALLTLFTVVQ
jgi:hypothetical protein